MCLARCVEAGVLGNGAVKEIATDEQAEALYRICLNGEELVDKAFSSSLVRLYPCSQLLAGYSNRSLSLRVAAHKGRTLGVLP